MNSKPIFDQTIIDMTQDIEGDDDWHAYEDEMRRDGRTEEEKNVLRFAYMKGRYVDGLEVKVMRRGDDLLMETTQAINLTNLFEALLQIWMAFVTATKEAYEETKEFDDF
jgi:hypothetical protein